MSTALEITGFAALIAGIYLLTNLAVGLVALGFVLLFMGYAIEGVELKLPRRKKSEPEPKKRQRVPEALTNIEIDALAAAQTDR